MQNLRVAIVGIGNVGLEVAKQILSMKQSSGWSYNTRKLFLCSRDQNNLKNNVRELMRTSPNIELGYGDIKSLYYFEPHIVINCASERQAKQYTNRRKMGEMNLQLNRRICYQIPKHSLEIIVTNHVLTLPQDAVISAGRIPELTIGCAHIDSIRARVAIKQLLEGSIKKKDRLDLSDVFIIGSHDDNEMVLAHETATINGIYLREFLSLHKKFDFIENFATEFAHVQKITEGTTKELTAQAVIGTLLAVFNQKSYVSAGVLCDFKDEFFRDDRDYFKFEKPENPIYMEMRTGFDGLKAGFVAASDPEPEVGWFVRQRKATKEAFYKVAMAQNCYLKTRGLL